MKPGIIGENGRRYSQLFQLGRGRKDLWLIPVKKEAKKEVKKRGAK
jgi:hypothetical protein